MKTPPDLKHVKWVKAKGQRYGFFNTGRKKDSGATIYTALGKMGSDGFYDRYAACLAARSRKAPPADTFEKLADDFQNSREFAGFAEGTRQAYSIYLREAVERIGQAPLDDVKRKDVQTILDNEEWGAGKRNLFVASIGAAYKWGRGKDRTENWPTRGIATAETGERMPWPEDVLYAALDAPDDRVRLGVALLFYTGQRIGDVCAMRWSDLKTGALKIVQQKTDKALTIPLHSALRGELDRYRKRGITLLTGVRGGRLKDDTLRDELKAFCAKLGHPTLLPHGLRKNAVIALLQAGCSVAETAAITGQSYQLVEYYARQIDQEKMAGAAILRLEQNGPRKTAGKTGPQTRTKP